jgi:ABC-type nitrate/sulfonate/bicarbonate transport system substrate-binding protein
MQVRRRSFLVASAALSLVPCAAHAQSSDLIPLRVGAAMDDQSKPVFYALDNGLFAKAGLDVQLVALSGGGAAIAAAVVGGSLDLGRSPRTFAAFRSRSSARARVPERSTTTARSSSRSLRRFAARAI